jgi:hypothetical protein
MTLWLTIVQNVCKEKIFPTLFFSFYQFILYILLLFYVMFFCGGAVFFFFFFLLLYTGLLIYLLNVVCFLFTRTKTFYFFLLFLSFTFSLSFCFFIIIYGVYQTKNLSKKKSKHSEILQSCEI